MRDGLPGESVSTSGCGIADDGQGKLGRPKGIEERPTIAPTGIAPPALPPLTICACRFTLCLTGADHIFSPVIVSVQHRVVGLPEIARAFAIRQFDDAMAARDHPRQNALASDA